MNENISITDLADSLAKKAHITRRDADAFIREMFAKIYDSALAKETVKIKDLGTFKPIYINERESIDVNTGRKIIIAPHYRLTFIPDKALKDAVNKKFSSFESIPWSGNELSDDEDQFPDLVQYKDLEEEYPKYDETDFSEMEDDFPPLSMSVSDSEEPLPPLHTKKSVDLPPLPPHSEYEFLEDYGDKYDSFDENDDDADEIDIIIPPVQKGPKIMPIPVLPPPITTSFDEKSFEDFYPDEEEENDSTPPFLEPVDEDPYTHDEDDNEEEDDDYVSTARFEEVRKPVRSNAPESPAIPTLPDRETKNNEKTNSEFDIDYTNYWNEEKKSKQRNRWLPIAIASGLVLAIIVFAFWQIFSKPDPNKFTVNPEAIAADSADNNRTIDNYKAELINDMKMKADSLEKLTNSLDTEDSDAEISLDAPKTTTASVEPETEKTVKTSTLNDVVSAQPPEVNLSKAQAYYTAFIQNAPKTETIKTDDGSLPAEPKKEKEPEKEKEKRSVPSSTNLRKGESLMDVSQRVYGNRLYWVYIYEENKSRIANPDNVNAGIKLNIAPLEKYEKSPNTQASYDRAKQKENQIKSKRRR